MKGKDKIRTFEGENSVERSCGYLPRTRLENKQGVLVSCEGQS